MCVQAERFVVIRDENREKGMVGLERGIVVDE